ncbi:copper homeostasis protein CutC [Rossellomorea sp. LjRoot5]|uniref:copper homeostasis protein CutC n=1 Tax=Rossellomorea sp. LjRoot5 TaxID=3342331 RepID=UPI003ECE7256
MSELEVIVLNEEDARIAEGCGADRLELVSAIHVGGLTPDYHVIEKVIHAVSIPVQVMLRPHSKSFTYSDSELCHIIEQVKIFHQIGVRGIVFGALTMDGELDKSALEQILEASQGQSVTFHRAIDVSNSPLSLYKELFQSNVSIDRILTSGGKSGVREGIGTVKEMQRYEKQGGPLIMPGSGLTAENMLNIHKELHAKAYHFGSGVRKDNCFESGIDPQKVHAIKEIID